MKYFFLLCTVAIILSGCSSSAPFSSSGSKINGNRNASIERGKEIYSNFCVACHGAKAEGNLGPNLTDKTWIYGYQYEQVNRIIQNGTQNGMPEHSSKIADTDIEALTQYILALQPVKGKAAQGKIVEQE